MRAIPPALPAPTFPHPHSRCRLAVASPARRVGVGAAVTAGGGYPRWSLAGALLAVLAITGCRAGEAGGPPRQLTDSDRREIAATVEQRLREATDLGAGGDVVARMLSLYPDSGRVVSASAGQVVTDRDSLAASVAHFWEYIGQNMRSPEWRWGPMQVDVLGPDAAVVTAAYRIPHITPNGAPHVIGGAWTAVFARRSGRWVVVQEHLSDAPGPLSPTP